MTKKNLHVANNHDAIVCKCPKHRSHSDHTHTKRCPLNAQEIYNCPTCQQDMSLTELADVIEKVQKKATRSNIDHSTHDHPATPAARAICRKARHAIEVKQEAIAVAKKAKAA